ncbi:nucleotide pyrophosphohydrolase [Streptomyces sp. NPDC051173]|uniref:nucleotide pyrophosphohydrolase n=1 Tax=Streptomyces sp. NPDC051173 TaxID=3155164 RepID=UPI00345108B5
MFRVEVHTDEDVSGDDLLGDWGSSAARTEAGGVGALDLGALQERAIQIHDLYDQLNRRQRGRVWRRDEFMLGFVGDVGDLAKLVMAEEGARDMPGGREALEHEIADCLWSVLILARCYDVDLCSAFLRTMSELDTAISAQLAKPGEPASTGAPSDRAETG